jgi:hypothetical protein
MNGRPVTGSEKDVSIPRTLRKHIEVFFEKSKDVQTCSFSG